MSDQYGFESKLLESNRGHMERPNYGAAAGETSRAARKRAKRPIQVLGSQTDPMPVAEYLRLILRDESMV